MYKLTICFSRYFLCPLEFIDLEDNLFQGSIPHALTKCSMLEKIILSRNSFVQTIPSEIGLLKKLRVLKLNVNRFTGSIPRQIFSATNLQEIEFGANVLTGRIPPEIGNLRHAEVITFSHNNLRGEIPLELEKIKNLKMVHLHDNFLTGTAPTLDLVDPKNNSYISDCGRPFFNLPAALSCKSCSMCCNSLEKCQLNQNSLRISVLAIGYMVPLIFAVGVTLIIVVIVHLTNSKNAGKLIAQHKLDTVYCLIFSNNLLAWILYIITVTIQTLAFWIFLKRSNFNDKETEWSFTYRCSENNEQCINEGFRTWFGWVILVVMLIYFLGSDFIDGLSQLRKAVYLCDVRLFFSGLVLFFLTGLAFITSIVYNLALAETDPELIVNAVFLLFINDMDEKFLDLLVSLAPTWVDKRQLEIEEMTKNKWFSELNSPHSTTSEENGLDLADREDQHEYAIQRLGSRPRLGIGPSNSEGVHEVGLQRLETRHNLDIGSKLSSRNMRFPR